MSGGRCHHIDQEAFGIAVVPLKRQDFSENATRWSTLDVDDKIDGFSDLSFGVGERGLRVATHDKIGEASEGLLSRVGEQTSNLVEPRPIMSPEDIDTVVVPAHEDGVQEVFLEKNCWYSVRIRGAVRSQIKYIAVYEVDPVSAITYVAPVKSIEPSKDSGKVVLYFTEPAKPIGPIPLVKGGKVKALQNLRYTTHERLMKAKTLDEVFPVAATERVAAERGSMG